MFGDACDTALSFYCLTVKKANENRNILTKNNIKIRQSDKKAAKTTSILNHVQPRSKR